MYEIKKTSDLVSSASQKLRGIEINKSYKFGTFKRSFTVEGLLRFNFSSYFV